MLHRINGHDVVVAVVGAMSNFVDFLRRLHLLLLNTAVNVIIKIPQYFGWNMPQTNKRKKNRNDIHLNQLNSNFIHQFFY